MVEHTDGVDGYLLCRNPAVLDVRFVHRPVTVRMDGTEVGIDRFRLLFGRIRCCPFILYVVCHFADRISQYRVTLCDNGCQILFSHSTAVLGFSCCCCSERGLRFLPLRNSSSRFSISLSLVTPDVPPCSIQAMISFSKK